MAETSLGESVRAQCRRFKAFEHLDLLRRGTSKAGYIGRASEEHIKNPALGSKLQGDTTAQSDVVGNGVS